MLDSEMKMQTRNVQEEFEKITDSQVDRDDQIVQLKTELESALVGVRAANEENDRVRLIIGKLDGEIGSTKARIEEIEGQRPDVISTSLLDGQGFAEDDALLDERLTLERYVERLTLARPELERYQRSTARSLEIASRSCLSLEDQLTDRRDELKLRLARRRHGLG